jgi:hypothetical protein
MYCFALIIAVVHTHPNMANPEPRGPDLLIADEFQVPMFTITLAGMYLYDPATGEQPRPRAVGLA